MCIKLKANSLFILMTHFGSAFMSVLQMDNWKPVKLHLVQNQKTMKCMNFYCKTGICCVSVLLLKQIKSKM